MSIILTHYNQIVNKEINHLYFWGNHNNGTTKPIITHLLSVLVWNELIPLRETPRAIDVCYFQPLRKNF